MTVRRINLNNYTVVPSADQLKGEGLIITPKGGGKPLCWKRVEDPSLVVDHSEARWTPSTKISTQGSSEEYENRVNWWFASMQGNEAGVFGDKLLAEAEQAGMSIEAANEVVTTTKKRMIAMSPHSRKNSPKSYLRRCMDRAIQKLTNQ